jgi:hypothetical protein
MLELFRDHPRSVGESYGEHCGFAVRFGATMVAGGLAAILHGLMPFLFVTTGSETVQELNQRIEQSRAKAALAAKPKRKRRAPVAPARRRRA